MLWNAADPEAYDGGRPTDIDHLREFENSELMRRDDARWGGVLEVIPTRADYVLDLIRRSIRFGSLPRCGDRSVFVEPGQITETRML